MANLVVEMGNTALKAAWSEGTTLGKTFRYQGEKMMEFILSITGKEKPEVMAVASVRDISPVWEEKLRSQCGHLILLDHNHTDILAGYALPSYLSYDRAASVVATRFLFKHKNCTVFDFGTTLNVDFVDAEGRYLGGNVSPGCRTRFKSLNRYSKSLPLVDTPEQVPETGQDIESAIEAGVISGILFEIEGYARRRPDNILLFTGGDAIYFAKRMKNSIFVVSNLVLMGLAIMTDDYVGKHLS